MLWLYTTVHILTCIEKNHVHCESSVIFSRCYSKPLCFVSSAFPRAHHALAGPAQNQTRAGETSGHLCSRRRRSSPDQRRVHPCQREGVALLDGALRVLPNLPVIPHTVLAAKNITTDTPVSTAGDLKSLHGRGHGKPECVNIIDTRALKHNVITRYLRENLGLCRVTSN